MHSSSSKVILAFSFIFLLFISGCTTFQIIDLKPHPFASNNLKHSINSVAGIETINVVGREYSDADRWQQGLADAIREEGIFNSVSHPYVDKDNIDLLIRGKVSGNFRHHGAKNFFTWWPGPFIFAHNWRGSRYIYDAEADVEVIDANTDEVLGKYHAESSHEMVHKSNNPGPVIGALLIIPGVIKGGMSVSPRVKYRQLMYEVAYPDLWKKIALLIAEDQSKKYSQRMANLLNKCGGHLDTDPSVGMVWSEFTTCQTRQFRFLGQELMESGAVSIYISDDRSMRIHVDQDGRIINWYIPKKRRPLPSANVYQ